MLVVKCDIRRKTVFAAQMYAFYLIQKTVKNYFQTFVTDLLLSFFLSDRLLIFFLRTCKLRLKSSSCDSGLPLWTFLKDLCDTGLPLCGFEIGNSFFFVIDQFCRKNGKIWKLLKGSFWETPAREWIFPKFQIT